MDRDVVKVNRPFSVDKTRPPSVCRRPSEAFNLSPFSDVRCLSHKGMRRRRARYSKTGDDS